MPRPHGVTLIELIVVIGIVAILSTLAAPSFARLRHESGRVSAVNGFLRGVFLARSESLKRSQAVTICKSSDGSSCTTDGEWHDGWIVFVNSERDHIPMRDAGEDVIHINQGWQAGTITSNRASYTFRPHRQSVVNGTIVFCDPRGSAEARAIIISHTGRPRIAERDASNRALRCTAR